MVDYPAMATARATSTAATRRQGGFPLPPRFAPTTGRPKTATNGQGRIDADALEAERIARRLIAADALRESGYRHLMRALAAGGNAAQAARVMDECRAALATVSAKPSAETQRVFREIVPS